MFKFKQFCIRQVNSKQFEYLTIIARVLLSFIFISYGIGKLTGGQFGISDEKLLTPISKLDLFDVGWFLFDHQPFKAFVGISQLVCSIFLLWNRTVVIGAFMFIPIVLNILIIDLTIMPNDMAIAFVRRLFVYIVLNLVILIHYRSQILNALAQLTNGTNMKFQYNWLAYLLVPFFAILLEFMDAVIYLIVNYTTHLQESIADVGEILQQIVK
jgi:uncharacterized membrane protein YphA (DoxX/SURF4 family)